MLLLGVSFYLVLTNDKRNERRERRAIAVGSRAAAEGVAGGSQGRAVQQEGLRGSLPALESPDTVCRVCCTGRTDRECSPWASGSTCMDTTTETTNVRGTFTNFHVSVERFKTNCSNC